MALRPKRPIPPAAAGLALLLAALPLRAQETGGVFLNFTVQERLEAARNLALSPVSAGTTYRADTILGLSYGSVTRSQSLIFGADVALRAADGPAISETFDIADPSVSLSYERSGPGSRFTFDASYSTDDVAFLRPLSDFLTEDGTIELPEDLDDLTGSGRRNLLNLGTSLAFGQDGPFGFSVSAGLRNVDYSSAAATLYDNRRAWAQVQTQLAPRPGTGLTTTLRYTRTETDEPGVADDDRFDFDNRLSFELPAGEVFGTIAIDHANNSTRYGASTGWGIERPGRKLSLELGATRLAGGTFAITGAASYRQELARGSIALRANRAVTNGTDNREQTNTALRVNYDMPLNPRTSLSLGGNYVRTTDAGTDLSVIRAEFSAGLSHALSRDWNADLGYRRVYRRDESVGSTWADSDVVYFGISRSFGVRW